jgi:lantibiotic leader peptide-processing serine protease
MEDRMRTSRALLAVAVAAGVTGVAGVTGSATAGSDGANEYVVVYKQGADLAAAHAAIADAGGKIVSENQAIGVATVHTDAADFQQKAAQEGALEGAAVNEAIGQAPSDTVKVRRDAIEKPAIANKRGGKAAKKQTGAQAVAGDPLADKQWDMRMMGATPDGSYGVQQGSHAVRVGIIDTGIDGSHPDVAPNFDAALSRNFTVDDPTVDGPCADEPDQSCNDAADIDEDGHGTHVASTIGSPLNGQGIGGVAPKVDLVNLRAGQDSGYFFLGPTLDALTYAGDNGIDVVNMSFYTDPWLFNCKANPADSPAEQREQTLIIEATQRAIDYARGKGVTTIVAEGNGHTDLGHPTSDATSPDYPPTAPRQRTVDNSCLSMPLEANGVIGVTSVGPSKRKAYYSDYGVEQADVSAPGGDGFDSPPARPENLILAAYPESVGRLEDRDGNGTPDIDANGNPTTPAVVKQGNAYYQWIQGTSMAAPHAVGVAALIVAQYGKNDRANPGVTLAPDRVEQVLRRSAVDTPCPNPPTFVYPAPVPAAYTATCEGNASVNGFYGDGIVNAFNAVTSRR